MSVVIRPRLAQAPRSRPVSITFVVRRTSRFSPVTAASSSAPRPFQFRCCRRNNEARLKLDMGQGQRAWLAKGAHSPSDRVTVSWIAAGVVKRAARANQSGEKKAVPRKEAQGPAAESSRERRWVKSVWVIKLF